MVLPLRQKDSIVRIRHLIILFLLICCGVGAASAQDAPPGVFEAAVRAANAAKPGLGTASTWQWQRLNPTKLSSLGCPLVQGTDLGREVTPYSASLTFSGVIYVVYVSADGTLSQPCDPKFGALTASTPAPPSGCQLTGAAQPTFRIAPDASTAVLGGEVLVNGVAYAIGRTDTNEWYQTRNKANQIGWVSAKEVTPNGACDPLPITGAQNIDYVAVPCFVTAAQDFSNVRQTASTDGEILARLYENVYYQVYATTTDGQWLFINPGWVADRVTEKYGDCDSLEVNNDLVGVVPGTPTPFPTATPTRFVSPTPFPTATATIFVSPTVFVSPTPRPTATPVTCPGNPAGFLPPRLTFGTANARVIAGGEPNRLRAEPNTQALQVGTVQPGRTLDAVLNGPVCEGSYVWWFVEVDGVQGWTVESDASEEGAYYLEPIGVPVSNAPLATTAPQATAAPITIAVGTAAPTLAPGEGLFVNRVLMDVREEEGVKPIDDIRFYDDDRLIAVVGDRYFQWELDSAGETKDLFSVFTSIQGLDVAAAKWFILDWQGFLRIKDIWEDDENLVTVELEGPTDSRTLSVTYDGRYALTVGCNSAVSSETCNQGKIELWETATGKLIRSQPAHPDQPWGAAFSADDRRIISWGLDGYQIWDTQSGQFLFAYDGTHTMRHALSETDLYTLYCDTPFSDTGCRSIWVNATSLDTGETRQVLTIEGGEMVQPISVAISPDNQWMAVALSDESVYLYNLAGDLSVPTEVLETGEVNGVMTFNADATRLAVGNFEGVVQVWSVPQP